MRRIASTLSLSSLLLTIIPFAASAGTDAATTDEVPGRVQLGRVAGSVPDVSWAGPSHPLTQIRFWPEPIEAPSPKPQPTLGAKACKTEAILGGRTDGADAPLPLHERPDDGSAVVAELYVGEDLRICGTLGD